MVSKSMIDWHERFRQQATWTKDVRDYLFQRYGLNPYSLVIEIGSGTGAIIEDLLDQNVKLFGLDINETYLYQAALNTSEASYSRGDAHFLPFSNNSFDLVLCHFLLMWVENPIGVLREMARITKSGGNVVAFAEPDYGGRIDFPEELEMMGHIQTHSLELQGADPLIGRKLTSMFHQVGLTNIEAGIIGSQWTDDNDWKSWEGEMSVFESDYLVTSNASKITDLERLKILDKSARQIGDRVLFVPTFYARGFVQ